MAQLSDDCFAFGGPMMSVDEAVAHHRRAGDRGARGRDRRAWRCRWPHSRARNRGAAAAAAVHQFRRRWLCGARAAICRRRTGRHFRSPGASRPARPRARRSSPVTRCASSRARRCLMAPTPSSCRRTSASRGGRVVLPAGLKPGANVRPAGEDIPLGHAALKAGQRLRPQDVALAAAFGLTQLDVRQAHPRRGVLHRQ